MQRFQNDMESNQDILQDEIEDPIREDLLHQRFVDEHPKCRQDIQKYGNYLAD